MYEKKKHEYWAGRQLLVDFPGGPVVGSPPANAGGAGSIPGPGRFL